MSDLFWNKLNYFTGLMAIAVFFGVAAFAANLEIKDLDLWLHLRTGQYIVEHKAVPHQDVLSCTIAGKPWTNHEWLFQVIVYTIQHNWGFDGLITMQAVVVSLTFLVLLLAMYRRDRQWLAVFAMFLVLMIYQSRFTIRPDIFSLLFFAVDIYILSLCMDKRWSLWVLGLVQVLWVNMHGYFFFGPLLVVLGVAAELIKRHAWLPWEWNTTGRLADDAFKRLQTALWVLLAVCLVNPYGIEGAIYPLKVLFQSAGESKIFFKHIYELQAPFGKGQAYLPSEIGYYKGLILISALSFFLNRRKVDLRVLFLWWIFLLFSLAAIRNLVFFAAVAYFVILANSMTISFERILPFRFAAPKFKDLTVALLQCALAGWILHYGVQLTHRGYFDFDTYERKSEYGEVSKRSFAYHAVDFLIAQKIKGNFFNDFNSGAYLVGRTSPDIKVFIDGRTEVYGAQFFQTYQKIWTSGNRKAFDEAAQKYRLTGAFLNSANQQIPVPAVKLFYSLKDWRLVYFDYDGMIFLKNVPENQAVISRYAIDLAKWQPPQIDLQKVGSRKVYPFPNINRARVLMTLRLDEPALRELNAAITVAPDAMEIYQLRGDVYAHMKKYRRAFEDFRVATMLSPYDRHNRLRLAWAYERLGDHENALRHYQRLLADTPKDAKIKDTIKRLKERNKGKK